MHSVALTYISYLDYIYTLFIALFLLENISSHSLYENFPLDVFTKSVLQDNSLSSDPDLSLNKWNSYNNIISWSKIAYKYILS